MIKWSTILVKSDIGKMFFIGIRLSSLQCLLGFVVLLGCVSFVQAADLPYQKGVCWGGGFYNGGPTATGCASYDEAAKWSCNWYGCKYTNNNSSTRVTGLLPMYLLLDMSVCKSLNSATLPTQPVWEDYQTGRPKYPDGTYIPPCYECEVAHYWTRFTYIMRDAKGKCLNGGDFVYCPNTDNTFIDFCQRYGCDNGFLKNWNQYDADRKAAESKYSQVTWSDLKDQPVGKIDVQLMVYFGGSTYNAGGNATLNKW